MKSIDFEVLEAVAEEKLYELSYNKAAEVEVYWGVKENEADEILDILNRRGKFLWNSVASYQGWVV